MHQLFGEGRGRRGERTLCKASRGHYEKPLRGQILSVRFGVRAITEHTLPLHDATAVAVNVCLSFLMYKTRITMTVPFHRYYGY